MYRALLIAIFFLNKKNIAIFLKLYKVEKSQQKAIVVLLRLPFVVLWGILNCRSPPLILIFMNKNKSKLEDNDMRRFQDTDYGRNKYSKGIVYKGAKGYIEVTLEEYIRENPSKTEEDFIELKRMSDEIYYEQDREETRYEHKKIRIETDEMIDEMSVTLEVSFIEQEEKLEMKQAVKQLLQKEEITLTQKRRFYLHFFEGLSYRVIAKQEGVHFTSVQESIEVCVRKLKKFINLID